MTSTGFAEDENTLAGDFGEAWLEAVAAGSGLVHGRPATLDLEKADVELVLREEVGDTYNPSVKVQVKTTHDLREVGGDLLAYDLDVATYEVLRRDNHSYRRILAVIKLSDDGEKIRLQEEGDASGRARRLGLAGRRTGNQQHHHPGGAPAGGQHARPGRNAAHAEHLRRQAFQHRARG